jgi:hypothetical protein
LDSSRKLDDVPASGASGEAMPDVFVPVDDEGTWIVTTVERAWPDETRSACLHPRQPPPVGQHLDDGNRPLEPAKFELRRDHPPLILL